MRQRGATAVPEEQKALQPKIIRFDAAGAPLNAQDQLQTKTSSPDVLDWQGRHEQLQDELLKNRVLQLLFDVEDSLPSLGTKDLVVEHASGRFSVKAGRDFAPGELALVPRLCTTTYLTKSSTHPYAIQTAFWLSSGDPLHLSPCLRLPSEKSTGKTFVPPAWAARREPHPSLVNCVFVPVKIDAHHTLGVGEPPLHLASKTLTSRQHHEVPILTNSKALAVGDELVVQCAPAKTAARPKATTQWDSQHRKGAVPKAKARGQR